MVKTQK